MARFQQGRFYPCHPEKYVGDHTKIIYRSSWEKKLMIYLDTTSSILVWASEETPIMYISPLDGKPHRYFVDFLVKFQDSKGEIKKAAIEVKPHKQCFPPKAPKRQTQRYINEVCTYAVNESKWKSARAWCLKNGFEFWLLDEYHLGIAKRPKPK